MSKNNSYQIFMQLCPSGRTLLIVILLAFMGCKKTDSSNNNQNNNTANELPAGPPAVTPVGTPVGSSVSKVIGPSGGSISSPDGRMDLLIPAGALNSNTTITVQPVTNFAPNGMGLAYDLLPNGLKFSQPATLRFHYTEQELPDNLPYFLYIAYQDSSGQWIGDMFHRDFDSVARTVSLDISHFSHWAVGHEIYLEAVPTLLRQNETSQITVTNNTIISKGNQEIGPISQTNEVPAAFEKAWKVDGVENGNSTVGRVVRLGNKAIYTAPANITEARAVRVSVVLEFRKVVNKNGLAYTTLTTTERSVVLQLKPEGVYDYHVWFMERDSFISNLQGLHAGVPVYTDAAEFDVHIEVNNRQPIAKITNIVNNPPNCVPNKASFQGVDFQWLADGIGEMNISEVVLPFTLLDPTSDSLLQFDVHHHGAMKYGYLETVGTTVTASVPPTLLPAPFGFPTYFFLDLSKNSYSDNYRDVTKFLYYRYERR